MKIENYKTTIFFIVFFSISMIFILWKRGNEESKLLNSGAISNGEIVSFGRSIGSANVSATYIFSIHDKNYEGTFSHTDFCFKLSSEDKNQLKTIKFPVIYYPKDPEISRILLHRRDYEKFNVSYSDSLRYVLETYFDCK